MPYAKLRAMSEQTANAENELCVSAKDENVLDSPKMQKSEDPEKIHCDICLQIREGCIADAKDMENTPKCPICGRMGYINLTSGTALVCSSCPRGFRLKVWLKHENLLENSVIFLDIADARSRAA
jgi:hypothetical protein